MLTYFEDYLVGSEHITPARTITDADVRAFADLTGDHPPLHMDDAYARSTIFGARISHGLLGLALVNGLAYGSIIDETYVMAFLGIEWAFAGPIRLGDTVHARLRIADSRPASKPDRGIVREAIQLINQRSEIVQQGDFTFMIRRRSA